MEVTYSLTAITHFCEKLPSSVVTTISHIPPLTAVITPFSSTVAISLSLDQKVTFLLDAVEGSTIGRSTNFVPFTIF